MVPFALVVTLLCVVLLQVADVGASECDAEADFALVLDASGSITRYWKDQQDFANNFVSKLTLGANAARVAVLQFSDSYSVELSLSASSYSIRNAINNPQKSGGTNTAGGLKQAIEELKKNGRAGANKVIVLLTDGSPMLCSWCDSSTCTRTYSCCSLSGAQAEAECAANEAKALGEP